MLRGRERGGGRFRRRIEIIGYVSRRLGDDLDWTKRSCQLGRRSLLFMKTAKARQIVPLIGRYSIRIRIGWVGYRNGKKILRCREQKRPRPLLMALAAPAPPVA